MWALLEILILFLIGLVAVTEFFHPLITGKPFFGSFRKEKEKVEEPSVEKPSPETKVCDLKSKVAEAKQKVAEVKSVQEEVSNLHKETENLKKESDDMIK